MSGNETGSGEGGSVGFVELEPNTALCIALSAFGGFLEVSSTMCLAYPEHRSKMGKVYSKCEQRLHMVVNLSLMGVASVAYIVGSWFGPVSLPLPPVSKSGLPALGGRLSLGDGREGARPARCTGSPR